MAVSGLGLVVLNVVVLIGGLALLGLAVVVIATLRLLVGWFFVVVGGLVAVVALLGAWGAAGFRSTPPGRAPPQPAKGRRALLVVQFFLLFLLLLVVAIASGVFLMGHDLFPIVVAAEEKHFRTIWDLPDVNDTCTYAQTVVDSYFMSYARALGWIGIVTALVMLGTLVVTVVVVSFHTICMSLLGFQNAITFIWGVSMAALGIVMLCADWISVVGGVIWVPIVLLVLGVLVMATACMGCIGACMSARRVLVAYVIVLVVLLVISVSLGLAVFLFESEFWVDILSPHLDKLLKALPFLGPTRCSDPSTLLSHLFGAIFDVTGLLGMFFAAFLLWSIIAGVYLVVKLSAPQPPPELDPEDVWYRRLPAQQAQ